MAPESGFESAEQQSGLWNSSVQGGGSRLGGGLLDGLGGGFLPFGPGGDSAGGAAPWLNPGTAFGSVWGDAGAQKQEPGKEVDFKPQEHSVPEIKDAVAQAAGGKGEKGAAAQEQAILSPDKLDLQFKDKQGPDYARAQALGMTPDQYKQQYVHEFMARLSQTDPFVKGADGNPVLGKDGQPLSNYSAAQQGSLTAWGYNAKVDPSNVVDKNKETGLFAIRFEPTAAGAKEGRAPVVAFRGTEPDRGVKDAQTDLGDEYIGKSEYEPSKAEIAKLFGRKPGEKADVVGYSLGASLAQRSLVDNADSVRALSTFQGPGIKGTDAQAVDSAVKKNGIDVNHHFFTNDIVHRAGEQKVDGKFHEYTRSDWATGVDTLGAHTSSFLIPSDGAKGTIDGHGKVKQDNAYLNATDQNTSIQSYDGDRQSDRAFWEAQRRKLGPSASGLLGEVGPAMNLWQKTDSEFNPVLGPDGKPQAGPLQNSVNQVKDGWQDTQDGWSGIKQGAGQAGSGVADMLKGNWLKGGMGIGQGLWNGFQGVKEAGGGISDMWNGAKSGAGTLKNFWSDHIAPHGGDLKNIVTGLPDVLAHLGHDKSIQKKLGPHGGPIVEGLATAYDQGKALTGETIGDLREAGQEIGAGWGDTKAGFGGALKGAGQAGHGVKDLLSGNFGQGAKDIWGGAKNAVGGIKNGFSGIGDMIGGAKDGFGAIKDAWGGAKDIWHDNIASNAGHYKALAGQALKPITQPISNAWNAVEGTAKNVGSGISNGFNSAVNATKKTVSNIGSGISNGVSSLANKAKKLWPF